MSRAVLPLSFTNRPGELEIYPRLPLLLTCLISPLSPSLPYKCPSDPLPNCALQWTWELVMK